MLKTRKKTKKQSPITINLFKVCIALLICGFTLTSCDSDDTPKDELEEMDDRQDGLIILSSYSVDFGEVNSNTNTAKSNNDTVVPVTLTNNSNEVLTGLSASIDFPGKAAVEFQFKALDPGESMTVNFTFGPSNLGPGVYTGEAVLTPSIGEEIKVELKATVI